MFENCFLACCEIKLRVMSQERKKLIREAGITYFKMFAGQSATPTNSTNTLSGEEAARAYATSLQSVINWSKLTTGDMRRELDKLDTPFKNDLTRVLDIVDEWERQERER